MIKAWGRADEWARQVKADAALWRIVRSHSVPIHPGTSTRLHRPVPGCAAPPWDMRSPTARQFGPRDGGFVVSRRAADGAAWWPAAHAPGVRGLAWEREGVGAQRGQPLLRRKERRLAAGPWGECTFDGSLPDTDPLTAAFFPCLRSSASRNLRFTSSSEFCSCGAASPVSCSSGWATGISVAAVADCAGHTITVAVRVPKTAPQWWGRFRRFPSGEQASGHRACPERSEDQLNVFNSARGGMIATSSRMRPDLRERFFGTLPARSSLCCFSRAHGRSTRRSRCGYAGRAWTGCVPGG
jgi:hypothetical protein